MFEDNNNVYILKKQPNESNMYYYAKCNYFRQCKNNKSVEHNLKMANMYANNLIFGCIYNDTIMNELNNFIS